MRNFKYYKFIFVYLVLCYSIPAHATDRYRIGVIIPLSGSATSIGTYVRNGISLAYENLDPNVRGSIELVYQDDQFDPKQTLSAHEVLSGKKALNAVFVLGSPPAGALAPVTESKKELLIAIGASDPNIAKDRKYTFTHWVIPAVLGEKLATELLRRDFKRIAFVAGQGNGALADINAAMEALREKGSGDRIVNEENYQKNETDLSSRNTEY